MDIFFKYASNTGFNNVQVSLATADISIGVPKAFELPNWKEQFLDYARAHPEMLWVTKSNEHRGIKIHNLNDLNLDDKKSFVQQYISNPLLIDQRKFDIGVYTVVTSVSPLRVYVYEGDVLLRFCPKNYDPFDANDMDKYVVGDHYTPVWQMPSLKKYYVQQQMTFRETLNAYLQNLGKDPSKVWEMIKETIATVFESQQKNFIAASQQFSDKRSFFELSRFDFILDSDLNIYLMEANMSPNLSSGHFAPNKLLYEQIITNLFSLVGIATHLHGTTAEISFKDRSTREMMVSERDLRVYANECTEMNGTCYGKDGCKAQLKCGLCGHCMTYNVRTFLRAAYEEHINRRNMRRILPRTKHRPEHVNRRHTDIDRLLILWFTGKCKQDPAWCI